MFILAHGRLKQTLSVVIKQPSLRRLGKMCFELAGQYLEGGSLVAGVDGKLSRTEEYSQHQKTTESHPVRYPSQKHKLWATRERHIDGEDGSTSLCVGKKHSPNFAFCTSHFLLAPEGLSCLPADSKNLPAGGRGLGKKHLISRFHSQIPTELEGCVF